MALLLAGLLFWAGTFDTTVFAFLTRFWANALSLLGLADTARWVQSGISGQVTTRSLPAMLSYGLLYTSTCLLLLRLLLPQPGALRLALLLYATVFAASTALVLGGKLGGDIVWAYQLGRRLIDFIVSPLPVIVLLPLLYWYYPAERRL